MASLKSSTPTLVLKSGDFGIDKITTISTSPFLLGRGVESSLKLRQKSVSRKQCSIEKSRCNWAIKSLGSRATTLNGIQLEDNCLTSLKCSDIIELPGAIKFEFKCSPDQNGRCCEDLVSCSPVMCSNNSSGFLSPISISVPSTSTHDSSPNSVFVERSSPDCSVYVVEDEPLNAGDLVKMNKLRSEITKSSNFETLLEIDHLTERILMFVNHLEESESLPINDNNCSKLTDELSLRLECAESIKKYEIDKSCKAHERNGNIKDLIDVIKKLSLILDRKNQNFNSNIEDVFTVSLNQSMERMFLSIDMMLMNKAKILASVLNELPHSSLNEVSIAFPISDKESKVSRMCCCKQQTKNVINKKRKEPASCAVNDSGSESDLKEKIKWQEAKIQFLQMKLKEKENVTNELESIKEENDRLVNKVSELVRTLADKEVLELEFQYLQESVKYKEEDKRSKDLLQERINSLQSENTNLKSENGKLLLQLDVMKNESKEMMDKYKNLEEKFNQKMNQSMTLGSAKDNNDNENYCCELGRAKTSNFLELIERDLNCSICGDMFVEPTVTNCNHAFCSHCLKEWKKMKRECPFCRTIVVKECKLQFLDEFINSSLKLFSSNMYEERLRLVQERKAPPVVPPPAKRPRTRARAASRTVRRSQQNLLNPVPFPVDPKTSGSPLRMSHQ